MNNKTIRGKTHGILDTLSETWQKRSVIVPCHLCSKGNRTCNFLYKEKKSMTTDDIVQNTFLSKCCNTKCRQRMLKILVADVLCQQEQCDQSETAMKCSFIHDSKQGRVTATECLCCKKILFSPYTCIQKDCYYPLFPLDKSLTNFYCPRCFNQDQRRYTVSIQSIEQHKKALIQDPSYPRGDDFTCPRCMKVGYVAIMDPNAFFSYQLYCTSEDCLYSWKYQNTTQKK